VTLAIKLAAAIVVHGDQVLVVRRSKRERFLPRVWGVPCGKVDVRAREKPREAVLRELREETGLSAEVVCFVGRSKFESDWHGQKTRNVQRNYLVRPLSGSSAPDRDTPASDPDEGSPPFKIVLPEEDQEYEWLDRRTIKAFNLDDHNIGAIRQALVSRRAAWFWRRRLSSRKSRYTDLAWPLQLLSPWWRRVALKSLEEPAPQSMYMRENIGSVSG
jgi:8-oxo-dGTP diphosphatase